MKKDKPDKPDKPEKPSSRRHVEVTANPFVEITCRLTPNQYRILNSFAKFNGVCAEAMASMIITTTTDRAYNGQKLNEGHKDYLEGLGF